MSDIRRNRLYRFALVALLAAVELIGQAAVAQQMETLQLDADAAAKRAVEVSHRAAAAKQRVVAAQSDLAAADAARLPRVDAAATAEERSSVPELTVPFGASGPTTIFPDIRTAYGLALGLTQPVYAGGSIAAGRAASSQELTATESDQHSAESGIALQARLAYWRAAGAIAAVDAARKQQQRAQRLQTDAESLRQAGMAVKADVLAAESRLAAARLTVIEAQTAADNTMVTLRSLLAVPAGTAIELADSAPQQAPRAPEPLADLQSEARSHRPELVALAARVEATAARERVVRATDRPTVGATVAWNLARPNPRYLPLADEWNDSWSVGISASWALWDGGRTRARAASVEAKKTELVEELAEVRRQVDLDVEQARLGLTSALAAVDAADLAQKASSARLEAEDQRYGAGLSTTSDVLDAQADLAVAESQQVQARTGAWMARARLEWAVGR